MDEELLSQLLAVASVDVVCLEVVSLGKRLVNRAQNLEAQSELTMSVEQQST
jgi:hypothetical protein